MLRVLREEWVCDGLVMNDWEATDPCSHAGAINAGIDLIMTGNKGVEKTLEKALPIDIFIGDAPNTSAGRVLEMIFKSETCKGD